MRRASLLLWSSCCLLLGCQGPQPGNDTGATETSATGDGDGDPGDGDGGPGDGDGDGDGGTADCPPLEPYDIADDWAALTAGVSTIDYGGGTPSTLVVHGARAFSLLSDADGDVGVAAAHAGLGRVVVWSHGNQLGGQLAFADGGRLAENAARWTAGIDAPVVGLAAGLDMLGAQLQSAGLSVMPIDPEQLDGVDVFAMSAEDAYTPAQLSAVAQFVSQGGGLLIAGQAWWWASQNPGLSLAEYPGNVVLAAAGISITEDAWAFDGPIASVGAGPPSELSNPHHAIEALRLHALGQQPLAPAQLDEALASAEASVRSLGVPEYPEFFCRARAYADVFPDYVPTKAAPFIASQDATGALALTVDVRVGLDDVPEQVIAHAAAAEFPGTPDAAAQAVDRTLTIDASHDGRDVRFGYSGARAAAWRSTGIYAPPGSVIELEVPPALVGHGLALQIGSHSDTLWSLDEWWRVPALVRSDRVEAALTHGASAFGGLVYVVVPTGAALGSAEVTVRGGIPAPHYVHGQTSNAQWIAEQRDLPGVWAELETDKFVITVPAAAIRTLDDPEALMQLWDDVLDAQATLAGIPLARPRAERFVLDRQISAGWMHSGYPIMAHLDSTAELIDLSTIQAGIWGPFHELGHNHQWREFVLPGTTEGNVNLWSVHTSETVLGVDRSLAHPDLTPANRAARIQSYIDGGADFWGQWSVWTALETYLQLQEAFGWQPFTDLHADYYYMLPSDPAFSDQQKIDAFAREFAVRVDRNLGPFFLAWGFPLSQSVIDELAALPVWVEDPMN